MKARSKADLPFTIFITLPDRNKLFLKNSGIFWASG